MPTSIASYYGLLKPPKRHKRMLVRFAVFLFALMPLFLYASGEGKKESVDHASYFALTFLWIAVILIAAKLSSLIERLGQPPILGELFAGLLLGNLTLMGIHVFEPIKHNEIITFLSELGVVILLFQLGLESNMTQMRKVGMSAFLVGLIGIILPFVLGAFVVGPWLLPGLSFGGYLFLGATLTATSTGIASQIFRDLGRFNTPEAKIVLGAAVIDDVLALVILGAVSAIATVGTVSMGTVAWLTVKAILFLVGAIVIGSFSAPHLGRLFSSIHQGVGMKFTLAIAFGLVFAYLASLMGLAPIVGAFAAGLVLDSVHFRYFKNARIVHDIEKISADMPQPHKDRIAHTLEQHAHRHIEDIIEPVSYFLVPIFFILTSMQVKIDALFNPATALLVLGLTVVAIVGKLVCGLGVRNANKLIVSIGMIPRGEVGLIFATIGRGLGVVSETAFSVIVMMVILTTLLTPPILTYLLKRSPAPAAAT